MLLNYYHLLLAAQDKSIEERNYQTKLMFEDELYNINTNHLNFSEKINKLPLNINKPEQIEHIDKNIENIKDDIHCKPNNSNIECIKLDGKEKECDTSRSDMAKEENSHSSTVSTEFLIIFNVFFSNIFLFQKVEIKYSQDW